MSLRQGSINGLMFSSKPASSNLTAILKTNENKCALLLAGPRPGHEVELEAGEGCVRATAKWRGKLPLKTIAKEKCSRERVDGLILP